MAKVIARHQEYITVNPYEFILESNGEVKVFQNDEEALNFLDENSDTKQDKEAWSEEGIFILEYSDCFN